MKGIEVKKRLQNNGFSLKAVADLMGETPQNLNSMLAAQDIKTGTLERIAKAINKSLYFFFDEKITLMDEKTIAQQDADIKAGKVIESVGVPASVSNHPAYQNLLEKVQELATENSNLNIELKDAYKEISELQKTLLNRV